MPCRDDPYAVPQGILSRFDNERDQLSTDKANQAVVCRVVAPLIFDIRETEQLVQVRKINLAPLQDLLSLGFIPSNAHKGIVGFLYLFAISVSALHPAWENPGRPAWASKLQRISGLLPFRRGAYNFP